ncbi:MAG: hypothetical protein SNJ75_05265 [Gemmataceae bacterium]
MAKKTICSISRKQFHTCAKPVEISVNGTRWVASPKEFSTGSLGWYLNEKVTIEIDGIPVTVQVGMNLTIVGSKELSNDPPPATDGSNE